MKKLEDESVKMELARLPLTRDHLVDLFDYLDEALSEGCDHKLTKTKEFLNSKGLSDSPIINWLYAKGGGCDCEVLNNVEDFCMDLFGVKNGDRLTRSDEGQ